MLYGIFMIYHLAYIKPNVIKRINIVLQLPAPQSQRNISQSGKQTQMLTSTNALSRLGYTILFIKRTSVAISAQQGWMLFFATC